MADIKPDVKTKEASSASSADDSVHQKMDATADSSTENNASSTSTTQDVKSESLSDMVKKTIDQHNDKVDSEVTDQEEEGEKEKSDSENELDKDKEKEEKVDEEKEDSVDKEDEEKEKNDDEKGPIPYERFQEVVAKRKEYEEQVKAFQPKAENFDRISRFCTENNIAPDDFQKALETQALISRGDLPEAVKRLTMTLEQLQGYTGDKLPDDLQAKVDDGKLELGDAKELAQLRAKAKFGEASSKRLQQTEAERKQAEYSRGLENAAASWETAKQAADPDYKPKTKESEPDGKWEDVRDKYVAMVSLTDRQGNYLNPVRNASEMTALMERAYKAVNEKWSRLTSNRSATRKRLTSNGSSKVTTKKTYEDAGSMSEAITLMLESRK